MQWYQERIKALAIALTAAAVLLGSGCAASPPLPHRQLVIGQIAYVATAEEASRGFYYTANADEAIFGRLPSSENVPPAKLPLASCGYNGAPDVRFALVRLYYHWLNASQDIVSFSPWTMVESGVTLQRGNIVEVELRSKSSDSICAVVTRVRAANLKDASCEYRVNQRSAVISGLAVFSPAGGPGTASIYCPFLANEGWKPVPFGPLSGGFGGFAWTRVPSD